MSENGASVSATANFTERELQMLGWAMQSLKTGPPDIDYDKLAQFAGMSNPRSASNAWAKIRVKLVSSPAADGTVPVTPKKGGRPKKTVNTDVENGGDGEPKPKKTQTPKKRAAKKQDVDGEASPKKKAGRPKKVVDDESKAKPDSESEGSAAAVKYESADDLEEAAEEV